MAVVEYKHHVYLGDHRRHIPGFIKNAENWQHPTKHSYVGWTPTNPDFYVPNTLKQLTKEDFVLRLIEINAIQAITQPVFEDGAMTGEVSTFESEEALRTFAENWYDNYVTRCEAEEQG